MVGAGGLSRGGQCERSCSGGVRRRGSWRPRRLLEASNRHHTPTPAPLSPVAVDVLSGLVRSGPLALQRPCRWSRSHEPPGALGACGGTCRASGGLRLYDATRHTFATTAAELEVSRRHFGVTRHQPRPCSGSGRPVALTDPQDMSAPRPQPRLGNLLGARIGRL